VLRIQLIDAGLRSVNLSLKRWLFELIKEIAFLTSEPSTNASFRETL